MGNEGNRNPIFHDNPSPREKWLKERLFITSSHPVPLISSNMQFNNTVQPLVYVASPYSKPPTVRQYNEQGASTATTSQGHLLKQPLDNSHQYTLVVARQYSSTPVCQTTH